MNLFGLFVLLMFVMVVIGFVGIYASDFMARIAKEKAERASYLNNIFPSGNEIDVTGFWEEDNPQQNLERLRIAREEAEQAYAKALDQMNSQKGYRL